MVCEVERGLASAGHYVEGAMGHEDEAGESCGTILCVGEHTAVA